MRDPITLDQLARREDTPALDRKREEVVEALGEIMDRVAARNGF